MAGNRLKLDKTELLWAGTIRLLQDFTFPSLQLAVDVITQKQHVRVFGVVISADLSRKKDVTNVSATCFHHLRRLRHIRQMLTAESVATIIHAFVMSRVDYCNVDLAGAPTVITNKLQRVINVAAHILAGTRKFDRSLTQLMHDNLHWLDVPESVKYKVTILTCRCLIGTVPQYLSPRWHRDAIYAPPLVISLSCGHLAFGCFLYSVRDYGTLCLDCCVTLTTTLLALDIL